MRACLAQLRSAEFTVQVGGLGRQFANSLRNGGIFAGPVVAPAGQDLNSAGVEPGVHPIAVELDFVTASLSRQEPL